ncbi:hypothetical protein FPV67DRAFT_917925 [Lyophyllum atratum]|nr:hypothetical protein FPV67DRAFT_917925 [Lyophyllum atratum]
MTTTAIIAAAHIQSGRYITLAVYAIQVCEWVASFDDEWVLIHRARWSSVKIAYLCCRYYPLLTWPFYIWAFVGNHEAELCSRIVRPLYFFMIPYQLAPQVVMVIRAWAFAGRQAVILAVLASAYVVLTSMEIWVFATDVGSAHSASKNTSMKFGCVRNAGTGKLNVGQKTGILFMSAFFLDVLCTVIMTMHCIRLRSLQGPLGKTFIRQGFGAFFLMSIIHIMAATAAFAGAVSFGGGLILPLPLILSNIVACRLTLDLRKHVWIGSGTDQLDDLSRVVRNAAGLSGTSRVDDWRH